MDVVEREGVARSEHARGVAELTLVVLDHSEPLTRGRASCSSDGGPRDRRRKQVRLGPARLDRCAFAVEGRLSRPDVSVSAKTGEGLDELRAAPSPARSPDANRCATRRAISNTRHIALLEQARASLSAARISGSGGDTPEEFVLADLQAARARLDEIVGARTSDDMLRHIFERFCIGK